jgi:osmoprotectant transport system ATP-binding protein
MLIQYENISKFYKSGIAISNLNLDIQEGELVVFLGPSGSGKSTLLKMVNRMVSHDVGRILWKGQEIERINVQDLRRRMGYAIQSVGLFPHRTVAHNIATVPKLQGWSADRIQARVGELLKLLALEPALFADRYPHQLSGGQQQRVGVARAMAADPDVLLMDEPFGALDPVTRASLQLALKNLHKTTGKTILFVTHDIDEALLLATRIVLLNQGRIEQIGKPLELLQQSANDFVAHFLGRENAGLQLLSLRPIAPHIKPIEGLAPTHGIANTANLKEAISHMAAHHVAALSVTDQNGELIGMVRAADCFENVHD